MFLSTKTIKSIKSIKITNIFKTIKNTINSYRKSISTFIKPKDSITLDDIISIQKINNTVMVSVTSDILLTVKGSVITVNEGYNITLAKEIHLNPTLNPNNYKNGFDNLDIDIEDSKSNKIQEIKSTKTQSIDGCTSTVK